jgi:hypothetical protein
MPCAVVTEREVAVADVEWLPAAVIIWVTASAEVARGRVVRRGRCGGELVELVGLRLRYETAAIVVGEEGLNRVEDATRWSSAALGVSLGRV